MTTAAAAPRALTGSDRALMYALSGVARSGATRSGYVSLTPLISIGGVATGAAASRRVLVSSLAIQDLLNETPNTCTFTVQGERPIEGMEIRISYGSVNNASALFAGTILRVTEVYVGQNPRNVLWQVEGIDWTWRLNSRLTYGRFTTSQPMDIVTTLLARFAPTDPPFTLAASTETLPAIDEISFTNVPLMEAITQVASRIGGYASCDYNRVIHLWLTDSGEPPVPLTIDHPSLESVAYTRDLSQIVTRAIVEGGGVNALADVAAGASSLPVEDTAWYPPGGGALASGPQWLQYLAVVEGGDGALVGTGVSVVPASSPSCTRAQGAGLPFGQYQYAYTWQSASGETTPSPALVVNLESIPNPTIHPVLYKTNATGSLAAGYAYYFAYQYAQDDATPPALRTQRSPAPAELSVSGALDVRVPHSGDPAVKWIHVLRMKYSGGGLESQYFYYSHKIANDPTLGGQFHQQIVTGPSDAVIVTQPPLPDNANTTTGAGAQVTLTGIQPGPGATTGRKVYRTAVNGSQLKLHTTIANNTATAISVDTTPDGSLGANAPTTNTAGLVSTVGTVTAGATTIPVSSTAPFPTAGWALIGAQRIRYTGKTSTTLTGIPSTGAGSLTASVQHGSEILVAPQLTGFNAQSGPGFGGIGVPIKQGDPVNLLVLVNDTIAQAALAALLGGSGMIDGYLQDNRIAQPEALSRAYALLAQKKDPQVMLRYRCRDPLTRSGATITVDLPPPVGITGTFQIQDVTINGFLGTNHYPIYDVVASSARFTFEDLLRQARTRARSQPS